MSQVLTFLDGRPGRVLAGFFVAGLRVAGRFQTIKLVYSDSFEPLAAACGENDHFL
jgi:hypothetical protein